MKKFLVLSLMVFCVFVPPAIAADRPEQVLGLGAGYFAGVTGGSIDFMSHVPKSMIGTNDLYLRVGLAFAERKSLSITANKEWRKFIPVYIDVMYYFYENMYLGAGLNYPIMVSDKETGNTGSQVYMGMDMDIAFIGKAYIEAGWGSLRILEKDNFEGLQGMIGLRYDLVPASTAPESVTPSPAPAPEVAPTVTPETVTKATPEQIANLTVEIEMLESEFTTARNYVTQLDNKIAKAKKSDNKKKVSELKELKSDALLRADNISLKLEQKQNELANLEYGQ